MGFGPPPQSEVLNNHYFLAAARNSLNSFFLLSQINLQVFVFGKFIAAQVESVTSSKEIRAAERRNTHQINFPKLIISFLPPLNTMSSCFECSKILHLILVKKRLNEKYFLIFMLPKISLFCFYDRVIKQDFLSFFSGILVGRNPF
jgi:hypothetical protein